MSRFLRHRRHGVATPILLLLTLFLLACNRQKAPTTLPVQMAGEWRTDEARYHGRFIRLETSRVTFGLGSEAPDKTETVEDVVTPKESPMDYNVRLKTDDGSPDMIMLQFTPANGGELRFKNQPRIVWKRKNDAVKTLPQPAPKPESPRQEAPRHETTLPDHVYGEHVTVYKIDCLKPSKCRSY